MAEQMRRPVSHVRGRIGRVVALALATVGMGAAFAAPAQAAGEIEITHFDAGLTNYQAGGHPDAFVSFKFATVPANQPGGALCPDTVDPNGPPVVCQMVKGGAPKDVVIDLPKGLLGNPRGITQCTLLELSEDNCPGSAQVGVQLLHLIEFGSPDGGGLVTRGGLKTPVFNMVPERGEVAKFGFRVSGGANTFVSLRVRPDDYGITATVSNIFTGLPLWGTDMVLWGDPYDPAHTPDRYCREVNGFGCPAGQTSRPPFMVAPAECGVDGVTTLRVRSWQRPGDDDWSTASAPPRQVYECDKLTFAPTFDLAPTTNAPDAPMGLDVRLAFRQNFDFVGGLEAPPLRDATVTLPEGVSVNASSADGLQACTDAQLRVGSKEPVACPEASKIGTVEATTPVLNETLTGGIYLRNQNSDDPESGELFRIALVLENAERGLSIRLPGAVRANKDTGRIEASFLNNPQLPVDTIDLHFKSGARAPLATPPTCGSKTTTARLTSWAGDVVTLNDGFEIACPPGLGGFDPFVSAGTINPSAGEHSPFALRFGRNDGQQTLRDLTIDFPEGLLAKIADINPLCSNAQGNAGTCAESSRIGSVISGAGAGSNPLYLPGRAYLTEGYKGAPFGMSIVVPAIAGPFNLGDVIVRAAIFVDENDASLRVIADPLPQIVKGVPLRIRSVEVKVDKPGFMVNPTSCDPMRFDTRVGSAAGAAVSRSNRFQLGDCESLPLRPRMALRVGSRGRTRRDITTPLSVNLTIPRGKQANLRSVRVVLPRTLNARLRIVNRACTLAAFHAGRCGADAHIGSAVAVSPLLHNPLRGDVFFVRSGVRRLPDLMVKLRGQVDIVLAGKVSIPRDLTLGTTFDTVPDVPVSSFRLDLVAGRNGPVGAVQNLCTKRARRASVARLEFIAHNGDKIRRNQRMQIAGCGRSARGGRGRRAGRRPGIRRAARRTGSRSRRAGRRS